ncbi:putative RiPP precursor [Devosia sp. Root105]|nr:putative RiPP precursor [Devosia sp. Root105]
MKKIYARPTLVKEQKLSTVTAASTSSKGPLPPG